MKGLKVTVADTSFDAQMHSMEIVPGQPDIAVGCQGLFLFRGGDLATGKRLSRRNLIAGKGDGAFFGDPTFSANYATLTTSSIIMQLPFTTTTAFTLMTIARTSATLSGADVPIFFGTGYGGNGGASMLAKDSDEYTFRTGYISGSTGGATFAAPEIYASPSVWRLVFYYGDNGGTGGWNPADTTRSPSYQAASAGSTRLLTDFPLSFGGNPGTSSSGTFDIAAGASWARRLSQPEMQAVFDRFKAYYAPRGIDL